MDKTEFEKLLYEYENVLKRFVYYKTPTKTDGDDVLQETLLAAFNYCDSVKNADCFKPWLLRIAANKCNDFYRKRVKKQEIPIDEIAKIPFIQSRCGLNVANTVRETLCRMTERDAQILRMFYIQELSQSEIANNLEIPSGTVKSRLYSAKQRFRSAYPYPPKSKGKIRMKKLPEKMPSYTIKKSEKEPFTVKWEELMGWFIVPRLDEKLSWAMYDAPERTITARYDCNVTGSAYVHGIKGVKIEIKQNVCKSNPGNNNDMFFIAQLTDTHSRFLAESHYSKDRGAQMYFTFLDGDTEFEDIGSFMGNWGFGEDNCGNEINLRQKGNIRRNENIVASTSSSIESAMPFLLDVVGRYDVVIGGKRFDTVCVMDIECYNNGVVTEQFLDQNGKTVLWRRFNRDDWHIDFYKQRWSEKLPENERLTVNGVTYVHWYDCITDYFL